MLAWMAIGQTFRQQFKAGDVVYGISQARAPYINSLDPAVAPHLRASGHYLICDEFNNRTFGHVMGHDIAPGVGLQLNTKTAIKTNLGHHRHGVTDPTQHTFVVDMNRLQRAALEDYYEALSGTKYAPLKAVKLSTGKVLDKGNQNKEDLVFRRACKFGLQYFIEHKKANVHFVLDVPAYMNVPGNRLNSEDIVFKVQHAGHVPITTSELRCCYRNRMAWVPTGRLKFYFNLVEVNPPWVGEAEIWAHYERHRYYKHGGR